MSGICGMISFEDHTITADRIGRMSSKIAHRGPDDSGCYISPDAKAGLGFRRLSIVDLSTGHQPLSNEDGKVWIAFDGEIYDYRASRDKLLEDGHRFSTNSDTEVIVHMYEEYGAQCVQRLRGMFSFGIWDDRKKIFFGARDRIGKKPFFYTVRGKTLLFGSELKALLNQFICPPELDAAALDEYLAFGYIPAPRTIYRDIYKLPPGCALRFSSDGMTIKSYWSLQFEPEVFDEPLLELQVEKLLREAVRIRLTSDVPLGALLSGGMDSSVVVALMAQEGGRPPKTFSVGFEESEFDELEYARKVAQHVGCEHHEQFVHADILELLHELVAQFDEPFADPSMIPTYLICRYARQQITVALSGDGGDEVFGGYPRYWNETNIGKFLRIPGSRAAAHWVAQVWPDTWPGKRQFQKMKYPEGARYAEQISLFDSEDRRALYHNCGMDQCAAGEFIEKYYVPDSKRARWEPLSRLQHVDSTVGYLPGNILTKVDMTSMMVPLEVRCPLLDQNLIKFMSRVPTRFKIRGGRAKYLLKKIGEKVFPREILYGSRKGFALPIAHWFRSDLRSYLGTMLLGTESRVAGMFRREAIQQLMHDHTVRGLDRSPMLFSLLCLEIWVRQNGIVPIAESTGTEVVGLVASKA